MAAAMAGVASVIPRVNAVAERPQVRLNSLNRPFADRDFFTESSIPYCRNICRAGRCYTRGGDFLDHADLWSMVVSGTALLFPRFCGVCGVCGVCESAGPRVALRFGDRRGGEALAVASRGGLSPAAGGDDAERERDESAASEDGPGSVA
jgi:hypothetical protein